MAVHYEVRAGETLAIRGPANVTVKGGEYPLIGDPGSAEPPAISAIDPDTVELGTSDFVLTVTGTGFVAASTIMIGVVDVSTAFVNETTLTTTLSPANFLAGPVEVKVRTGPSVSAPVTLTFAEPVLAGTRKGKPDEAQKGQKSEKRG